MKLYSLLSILILHIGLTYANNIQVTNVSLTGQNTVSHFAIVKFDISWENSWRVVGGPANWDAAWIFVKYRVGAGPWIHTKLNDSGHTFCAVTTVTTGLQNPDLPFDPSTNPGMGVFLYRALAGSGTFNCQNVQLRWNYGSNGLSDNEQVDIKVFAIEQVYIPGGGFTIGSGGTEDGAFYTYPTTTDPWEITSEAQISVGTTPGYLYYTNSSGKSGDQLGPIPAAFPKGFKAIYAMKYEVSQQGYVDFLNTLTRGQQTNRVESIITGTSVVNQFVMSNTFTIDKRNGIWSFVTIPLSPGPVIFFCNYNSNTIGNESTDGQNIACNYMYPNDLWAYLDWAGLRPMTELEFEKICRGPGIPVPGEYAWGNYYLRNLQGYTNPGANNETASDDFVNCSNATSGPGRCGMLAKSSTDRTFSGASYYGVLDLSGNVWERAVTAGHPNGRIFAGNHGNGELLSNGDAAEASWPVDSPFGGGSLRGGGGSSGDITKRTSDRYYGAYATNLVATEGGRGVRTAPQ